MVVNEFWDEFMRSEYLDSFEEVCLMDEVKTYVELLALDVRPYLETKNPILTYVADEQAFYKFENGQWLVSKTVVEFWNEFISEKSK